MLRVDAQLGNQVTKVVEKFIAKQCWEDYDKETEKGFTSYHYRSSSYGCTRILASARLTSLGDVSGAVFNYRS